MDFRLLQDTICAIATPIGEAGIGLIRLSGPEALNNALKIFRAKAPTPDAESPIPSIMAGSKTLFQANW